MEPFYKSAAFHEGVKFIENGGKVLCLTGQWGSGKTSTAKNVYKFVNKIEKHQIVIRNTLFFDVGDQSVIFDDAISKEITDIEKDQLRKLYDNFSRSVINGFIIITLDENMKSCYGFVKSLIPCKKDIKFIHLSKTLTKGDRTKILDSQLEAFSPNKDFSKVEQLALKGKDHSLGYPEICALFSRCTSFQNVGPVVFCNLPLQHLLSHLDGMHNSEENEKFLMLVYMSLNQMEIDIKTPNSMFYKIRKSCICCTGNNESGTLPTQMESTETTSKEISVAANDSYSETKFMMLLSTEFVVQEEGTSIYRLQHEVIKRMALIVFGTYHFNKLLEFSKQEELKGWIQEKSTFYNPFKQGDIKPVLVLQKKQWRRYQEILA